MLCGDADYSQARRHGRSIDPRQLTRVKTDADPRLWRTLEIEDDQSCAVQILIDTSGSTKLNNVLIEETKCALALASALEQFPLVDSAITHFPCKNGKEMNLAPFLKPFDRSVNNSLLNWPSPSGGTPLGAAYKASGLNFLLSEKERRILFVMTDGKPSDVYDAIENKHWLVQIGVEVYGVVIGSADYPLTLFDDSITITDASELPRAIMALVQRNL